MEKMVYEYTEDGIAAAETYEELANMVSRHPKDKIVLVYNGVEIKDCLVLPVIDDAGLTLMISHKSEELKG